jgi:hypothetical protein
METKAMLPEFKEFPKIARLSRDVIITEKIDGANAQVLIQPMEDQPADGALVRANGLALWAGSRNRWLTKEEDNFGFAAWVERHGEQLMALGPGRHFGEWWGSGIQRGYGLANGEKRWSLFNVSRWCGHGEEPQRIPMADPRVEKYQERCPPCCGVVPVLYSGPFTTSACDLALIQLQQTGSHAAPGYHNPEGIVVFHVAANLGFKKTIEGDEVPKTVRKK